MVSFIQLWAIFARGDTDLLRQEAILLFYDTILSMSLIPVQYLLIYAYVLLIYTQIIYQVIIRSIWTYMRI